MEQIFEDFPYRADVLSAYIFSTSAFIIALKDGTLTWFDPPDQDYFLQWLEYHNIRKMK